MRKKRNAGAYVTDAEVDAMRQHVRKEALDKPGVYRMISPGGEVLYVGKSKRIRSRLMSYFRCAFPAEKGARMLREANAIEWDYTPSEFAALLQELRFIKKFRPRFNVMMKSDGRHYAFIKLADSAAPKLLVVRAPTMDDSSVYYGPFHGAQRLGEAVRELSDALGLRDCALDHKMVFSDQPELFGSSPVTPGCIRYEIGKCVGPCCGACSLTQYGARVRDARAFLEGRHDGPIESLRESMIISSELMHFERAGSLRDKLQRLEDLREEFTRLRFAVETLSFTYTVKGVDGDDRVYVIRRGLVRAEQQEPKSKKEKTALHELVRSMFAGELPVAPGVVPTHAIDELMLVSSWFRRHPRELKRTKPLVA
ncbi:MAG: GIY-YIG nuclease family protein [Gemmatimonadaceae bacterium]